MIKPTIPPGTLLLWKGKYLRTVIAPSPGYVKLSIRRRSWTNRAVTTYMVNELKAMGCKFLRKKSTRPVLKSELASLLASKFNPRRELGRELKEAKAYSERSRKPLCNGWGRLQKLAEEVKP